MAFNTQWGSSRLPCLLSVPAVLAAAVIACGGSSEPPPKLPPNSPPGRVLVVGDSVAFLTAQGLGRIQRAHHLRVSNGGVPGCGIVRGGEELQDGVWTPGSAFCENWPQRWQSLVRSRQPEVVVLLTGFWDAFDRRLEDGRILKFGTEQADEYTKQELAEALDVLTSRGSPVLILTTPYFARAEDGDRRSARDERRVDHLNDLFEDVADRREDVEITDLRKLLTPDGYRTSIDGVDMRGDGVHLTPAGQRYVAEWFAPQLVEAVIEARSSTRSAGKIKVSE